MIISVMSRARSTLTALGGLMLVVALVGPPAAAAVSSHIVFDGPSEFHPGQPQTYEGEIHFSVGFRDLGGLPGIEIIIEVDGQPAASARTQPDGRFAVPLVLTYPSATHRIQAVAFGGTPLEVRSRIIETTVKTFELDIRVINEGATVRLALDPPPGIEGQTPGSYAPAIYPSGTEVEITPIYSRSTEFVGWGGDCSGSLEESCVLVMNADKAIIARFQPASPLFTVHGIVHGSTTAGDEIDLGIAFANHGGPATDVVIIDRLPAAPGMTWTVQPAPSGITGNCSITENVMTCHIPQLLAGHGGNINLRATTTDESVGSFTDHITMSARDVAPVTSHTTFTVVPA